MLFQLVVESKSFSTQNYPHKMHKRRIDLFVCFVSSLLIQNHIIFHTKCTGGGGWDQPAGVLHKNFRQRFGCGLQSWASPGHVARRGAPGPPMATCPHCLRQILLAALAAHIAKSHWFFSCAVVTNLFLNTCVKLQILPNSFTNSVATFLLSVQFPLIRKEPIC